MSRIKEIRFIVMVVLISTSSVVTSVKANSIYASSTSPHGFDTVIASINETAIIEHVKFLSSLESRFTGYPGFFEAAEYISSKFKEFGLEPYGENGTYFEFFNVTTPIDHGSFIILEDGTIVKAYSFYPNHVNSCPYQSPQEGDVVVYVGNGDLDDFKDLDVRGKFVLMDFASRWYYRLAILNGAKGVIYISDNPDFITRPEAEQKELMVPLLFPRLYVKGEEGGYELMYLAKREKSGIRVHIKSSMSWERIEVPNILGFIKGSDETLSKEIVVISAFYDSNSIIPALSPGATDSLGTSILLEIANFLSSHPAARSVLFVALAGHYQSLWGAREFIEKHFDDLGSKLVAFIGMDLSSGSDQVGIYSIGSAYVYTYLDILNVRYGWLVNKFFQSYLNEMKMILGADYGLNFVDGIMLSHPTNILSVRPFEPKLPGFFFSSVSNAPVYLFDSDPFVLAMYGSGFTYHTSNDFRLYQRTPNDVLSKINFKNVWPQVKFIFCTLWGFLNEPELKLFSLKSRFRDDSGYVTLSVQVSEYNMLTAYYDPVDANRRPDLWNDVLVSVTTAGSGGLLIISKVNEKGEAIIHGLKPYGGRGTLGVYVQAFVVNRTNGEITWSMDLGVWQAPGGNFVPLTSHPYTKLISIFPCASIAVIDAMNPVDYSGMSLILNDARAHAPMIRGNTISDGLNFMAFVMPDTPIEILLTSGRKLPSAVLNNPSDLYPDGEGYVLKQGENKILTSIDIANSIYYILNYRYGILRSKQTYTPTTELLYNCSSKYMSLLNESEKKSVPTTLGLSYDSWGFSLGLYDFLMDLTMQVILTIAVLFIVSVPFSLFTERLIFSFETWKRVLIIVLINVGVNFILYFLHPGYSIATNAFLVLISTGLSLVLFPLLAFTIQESYSSAIALRTKIAGTHFVEISRSGLASASITLGLEYMKKRKLRTSLTMASLTIIISSLVLLNSVTIAPSMIIGQTTMPSSYSGLMIRKTPWATIPELAYLTMKSSLGETAIVAPRAWLYPPPLPPTSRPTATGTGLPYYTLSPKGKTGVYGFLALSSEEMFVSDMDRLLVEGTWFNEADVFSVIIPDKVAQSLSAELGTNVIPGSTISIWGVNLTVRGIINSSAFDNFFNPDGEPISPVDPQTPNLAENVVHFTAEKILIVPYRLFSLISWPTVISYITIKPLKAEATDFIKYELPFKTAYRVYYAQEGELGNYVLSRQWYNVLGVNFLAIPTALAVLTIFNIMLGTVYERKREISIQNALGMSPLHISLSFVIEALSFAVYSIVLGYVSGLAATSILVRVGMFPSELYPNFSSLVILFVIGIAILMTLSSASYPSWIAAQLVVPSRVRRWVKTVKRKGDLWTISIPMAVNSSEEVMGIFAFLKEYFTTFTSERETVFSAENINFKKHAEGDSQVIMLNGICRIAPYDLGIMSDLTIISRGGGSNPYSFEVILKRTAGYAQTWQTMSPRVLDNIRKQFLIWRTLSSAERDKYIELGHEIFQEVKV